MCAGYSEFAREACRQAPRRPESAPKWKRDGRVRFVG